MVLIALASINKNCRFANAYNHTTWSDFEIDWRFFINDDNLNKSNSWGSWNLAQPFLFSFLAIAHRKRNAHAPSNGTRGCSASVVFHRSTLDCRCNSTAVAHMGPDTCCDAKTTNAVDFEFLFRLIPNSAHRIDDEVVDNTSRILHQASFTIPTDSNNVLIFVTKLQQRSA